MMKVIYLLFIICLSTSCENDARTLIKKQKDEIICLDLDSIVLDKDYLKKIIATHDFNFISESSEVLNIIYLPDGNYQYNNIKFHHKLMSYKDNLYKFDSLQDVMINSLISDNNLNSYEELIENKEPLYLSQLDSLIKSLSFNISPNKLVRLKKTFIVDDKYFFVEYTESDIRRYWDEKDYYFIVYEVPIDQKNKNYFYMNHIAN